MTHHTTESEYRPTFAALHTANLMALIGPATDLILASQLRAQAKGDLLTAVAMVALPRLMVAGGDRDEV